MLVTILMTPQMIKRSKVSILEWILAKKIEIDLKRLFCRGQRDWTATKTLALQVAKQSSVPRILNGPQALAR